MLLWGSSNQLVHDVIVDHCSLEWAINKNGNVWDAVEKVTFQYCIFGEASNFGHHGLDGQPGITPGYQHSKGFLAGGQYSSNTDSYLTLHHNFFTSNLERNPKLANYGGLTHFVNNLVYNWGGYATSIRNQDGFPLSPRVNLVGNVYVRGPGYMPGVDRRPIDLGEVDDGSVYVRDNLGPQRQTEEVDDWELVGDRLALESAVVQASTTKRRAEPWPVGGVPVTIEPASTVRETVAKQAGASYPRWDAVDARLIEELRQGTGDIGCDRSITEREPYPELAGGPAPVDTDGDGMPDEWERSQGLNPLSPSDGPTDSDGDGYTNLEEYLNGLVGEK